jgi:hypothetical protein
VGLKEKEYLEITPEMLAYFAGGQETADMFLSGDKRPGVAEWERCREQVLTEWVKDKPGSRPWMFWAYDSPDRPSTWQPINIDDVKMVANYYIIFGVTHQPSLQTFPEPPLLFESQASYLKRKKLLMRGELKRIPSAAFEPTEFFPFYSKNQFEVYSRIYDYEPESRHKPRYKIHKNYDLSQ